MGLEKSNIDQWINVPIIQLLNWLNAKHQPQYLYCKNIQSYFLTYPCTQFLRFKMNIHNYHLVHVLIHFIYFNSFFSSSFFRGLTLEGPLLLIIDSKWSRRQRRRRHNQEMKSSGWLNRPNLWTEINGINGCRAKAGLPNKLPRVRGLRNAT